MPREVIKNQISIKIIFHYFQKRHLFNKPDSRCPQWSRQAVITVSCSTWNDKKIKYNGVATNLFCLGVTRHQKRLILL